MWQILDGILTLVKLHISWSDITTCPKLWICRCNPNSFKNAYRNLISQFVKVGPFSIDVYIIWHF